MNELARRGGRPTFGEVFARLQAAGSATIVSSRGTKYTVTAKVAGRQVIVARPRSGQVSIHEDCWCDDITCQRTRAGGIYNGSPSIYDWFEESFRSRMSAPRLDDFRYPSELAPDGVIERGLSEGAIRATYEIAASVRDGLDATTGQRRGSKQICIGKRLHRSASRPTSLRTADGHPSPPTGRQHRQGGAP